MSSSSKPYLVLIRTPQRPGGLYYLCPSLVAANHRCLILAYENQSDIEEEKLRLEFLLAMQSGNYGYAFQLFEQNSCDVEIECQEFEGIDEDVVDFVYPAEILDDLPRQIKVLQDELAAKTEIQVEDDFQEEESIHELEDNTGTGYL